MTTDSRPKTAVASGDGWSVAGMAKGAGMLAPALATMLVVLTTDAANVASQRVILANGGQFIERFTKPAWSRASGIQPDELERLIDAVATALDGDPLTRTELADTVARQTRRPALGEKLRESWGAFLKPAAVRGA